jgi:hypothetical protein
MFARATIRSVLRAVDEVRQLPRALRFFGCASPKPYPHRKSGDSLARQLEEKTWMGSTVREILSCRERPQYEDGGTSLFVPTLHWCGLSSSIVTMMQSPKSGTRKNKA